MPKILKVQEKTGVHPKELTIGKLLDILTEAENIWGSDTPVRFHSPRFSSFVYVPFEMGISPKGRVSGRDELKARYSTSLPYQEELQENSVLAIKLNRTGDGE